MTTPRNPPLIGVGVYSIPEAARLSQVSSKRIVRWVRGYSYNYKDSRRTSPAVWRLQLPPMDGSLALGFRDLMEIRFIDAFLNAGVSWHQLRLAAVKAADLFKTTHPFSQKRFKTDGRCVFVESVDDVGHTAIWDIVRDQMAFERIISPYLRGIEFVDEEPVRWWPDKGKKRVVLDPQRSFGQPILAAHGVPTAAIFDAFVAERSIPAVAKWLDLPEASVSAAVEFEEALVA